MLDSTSGQLEWDYLDPEPPHKSRTFVIHYVDDPSCRLREDTFDLINHALDAAELPPLKRYPVLIPADRQQPTHGACARPTRPLVTINTNPDTPAPICIRVQPHQKLRVVNTSDRFGFDGIPVTVDFADFRTRTLDPGESTIFDPRFGQFLAPGVHLVKFSLYSGRAAEIWLTNLS